MNGQSLKLILTIDALTCAVMAALLLLAGGVLSGLLGIAPAVLTVAGVLLIPVAVLMALTAARSPQPAALVKLIVLGNVCWVIASVALVLMTPMNALGTAFVLAQAVVVALFAYLENGASRAVRVAHG